MIDLSKLGITPGPWIGDSSDNQDAHKNIYSVACLSDGRCPWVAEANTDNDMRAIAFLPYLYDALYQLAKHGEESEKYCEMGSATKKIATNALEHATGHSWDEIRRMMG